MCLAKNDSNIVNVYTRDESVRIFAQFAKCLRDGWEYCQEDNMEWTELPFLAAGI